MIELYCKIECGLCPNLYPKSVYTLVMSECVRRLVLSP